MLFIYLTKCQLKNNKEIGIRLNYNLKTFFKVYHKLDLKKMLISCKINKIKIKNYKNKIILSFLFFNYGGKFPAFNWQQM